MTAPRYTAEQMEQFANAVEGAPDMFAMPAPETETLMAQGAAALRQAAETERQHEAREKRIAALERIVRELRDCLQECADPDEGWPHTGIADTFEASRRLVPDAGRTP